MITVRQYQSILPIIIDEQLTDLDKLVKVIGILTGYDEAVIDGWPVERLNEYRYLFNLEAPKKVAKRVKANGRYYRFNWEVNKLKAARYIEAKAFAKNGLFENLHLVMASCVVPQRRIGFFYFDKKYDATKHEQYANDLLEAPFMFVYGACVFFCQLLMKWIDVILSYSEGVIPRAKVTALRESLRGISDGFITPL